MNNLFGGGVSALALLADIENLRKKIDGIFMKNYPIDEYPNIWDAPSGFYTVPGNSLLNMDGIPNELKGNNRVYVFKGMITGSDQSFCAVFNPAKRALYIGYWYGSSKSWQKLTGTAVT